MQVLQVSIPPDKNKYNILAFVKLHKFKQTHKLYISVCKYPEPELLLYLDWKNWS